MRIGIAASFLSIPIILGGCGFAVPFNPVARFLPKQVDKEYDNSIRGSLMMMDDAIKDPDYRKMSCSALKMTIAGLTIDQEKLSDKTMKKLDEYAKICGIASYENPT